jgi:oligopeptidase B
MMSEFAPPVAPRRSTTLERFGIAWTDEYAWLRDPAYPEVRDPEIRGYLEAENAYFKAVMAPHKALVERLHAEFKGRIKEDDSSVPVREGGFEYHWRYFPGAQYRTWFRRALEVREPAVLLDENALAEGRSYFNLRALDVSPDGRLLAYTTDEDGSERFGLHLRNLETGEELADLVTNTSGAVEWAEDGRTLLYVELNDKLRPFRVQAHRLGQDPAEDRVLYEEADPAFFVGLGKTRSRRFILISSGTHVTREIHLLDAADPAAPLRLVAARREGHRYGLDHAHGRFWILTNDRHENFRLVSAPEAVPEEAGWREEIAGDDHRYLLAVSCFQDFMVLSERLDGLADIRLRRYDGEEHVIPFPEPVYTVMIGDNREFATDRLRVSYTSMVTPPSVIDYVVPARELIVRKEQEIPSGYDKSRYVTRRLMAPAPDGTEVPITIVHRDDFPPAGGGPLFLYGYGSYGHGLDPAFAPSRLTLLDRGIAFAYAHVRGGDELGHRWYREGKLDKKTNSFTDFIACAEHLIRTGCTRPGQIVIKGGSAGGMLMGAAANLRPELWRCVIAEVPFVDVLNTMLDASLPLTPIEWPEWGNPLEDRAAFERIRSYSPYDNIRPQPYPPMLVTAGISDPRVTYWEPAKFVARLRATKTDTNLLLLKTNMNAGHFGKSGRFDALYELAEQYAFVFACFGMAEQANG